MTVPSDALSMDAETDERLALPVEQGVLLWSMRMWVIGMKLGMAVEARVQEMFDLLGAPGAAPFLQRFMVALSQGCIRMIDVRCVCQPRLDADERALLDVLSLAQAMRPFDARRVLCGVVTPAGADAALRNAEGLGTALAQAGLFLPEPDEGWRPGMTGPYAAWSFSGGGDTLH